MIKFTKCICMYEYFCANPFSTPWKTTKSVRFSDVFRGYRKGALGMNGLIWLENYAFLDQEWLESLLISILVDLFYIYFDASLAQSSLLILFVIGQMQQIFTQIIYIGRSLICVLMNHPLWISYLILNFFGEKVYKLK